jgi:hypothetical protein
VRRADTGHRWRRFVVLCDGRTGTAAAHAERILASLSETFDLGGEQALSASSASPTPEHTDVEALRATPIRDVPLEAEGARRRGRRPPRSAAERVVLERALGGARDQVGRSTSRCSGETGELVAFRHRPLDPSRADRPERFIQWPRSA